MKKDELRYLQRLAEIYPTIGKASTEIINLQSILNLPKGTEHFMSDLHGEYQAFSHVLRNGSGAVRKKIDDVFGHTLSNNDKRSLATLIYYPKEKMDLVKDTEEDMENWYKITLYRLIEICKTTASKYTRSKVRKALPADYAYVIEKIRSKHAEVLDKEAYYDSIVNTIIEIGSAENFIIALAELIQRLVVDHLHILGDIYDRGPAPHFIMDRLMQYHSLDIQWGNHDVVWMGAAAGQKACIATVVRNSIRYGNLDILEDGYGINMLPLATFVMEAYKDDPCEIFAMKGASNYNVLEEELGKKMHKAIAVIQFKLEGKLVRRHKEFQMEDRALLHRINPEKGTITLPDGKEYPLRDNNFPTIDWKHPYELTAGEKEVMDKLSSAFSNCETLQNHIRLLLDKGGLYTVYNGNLLFHGSIPLNEDGTFREVQIYGKSYKGKELYDVLETYVRRAFYSVGKEEQKKGRDIMWYIWAAPNSPLFGKSKMSTFERYFIEDPSTHEEKKNAYYRLWENEEVVDNMLREFGLDPEKGHIINGHVPVHQSEGESPVKANGKLIIIDGGFCRAYHKKTGIAGYTLISNSRGLRLLEHQSCANIKESLKANQDIESVSCTLELQNYHSSTADTDLGEEIQCQINDIYHLMLAYQNGLIPEQA